MHHPTDRIAHTTAFVTAVVEHGLEQEIAQRVHPMKDRSDDPSHHERTLLPRSYISFHRGDGCGRNVSMALTCLHNIRRLCESPRKRCCRMTGHCWMSRKPALPFSEGPVQNSRQWDWTTWKYKNVLLRALTHACAHTRTHAHRHTHMYI